MKRTTALSLTVCIILISLAAASGFGQTLIKVQEESFSFSNPDKPKTLKITGFGNLNIYVNEQQKDVKIEYRVPEYYTLPKESKRKIFDTAEYEFTKSHHEENLSPSYPYTNIYLTDSNGKYLRDRNNDINFKNNILMVRISPFFPSLKDLFIEVPPNITLDIENNVGNVEIIDDKGLLKEISLNTNQKISLKGIKCPVTANTFGGPITVEFGSGSFEKPMSFITVERDVTLIFPQDAKAKLVLSAGNFIAVHKSLSPSEVITPRELLQEQKRLKSAKEVAKSLINFQIKNDERKYKSGLLSKDKFEQSKIAYEQKLKQIEEAKSIQDIEGIVSISKTQLKNEDIYKTYNINGGGVSITASSGLGSIIIQKK
jgi:hypothetical protein